MHRSFPEQSGWWIRFAAFVFILAGSALAPAAAAECRPGIYGESTDAFMVLGAAAPAPGSGQRYLFRDGRRGSTASPASPLACDADVAILKLPDGTTNLWPRNETRETDATFEDVATPLAGRLIEPPGPADANRPLVVLVHGSEKTPAIGSVYAYMLAAQGVSVFVYDKRGTGASGGDYTQNFELLADDAAAALRSARSLAACRFARAGFFGGSQGGWVAPLAATRSTADFVAVGFGLVVSPSRRQSHVDAHHRRVSCAAGRLDQERDARHLRPRPETALSRPATLLARLTQS